MINIKGLNKAEVLQVLFNNSKIQGFNVQMVEMGLMKKPQDMTKEHAQAILDNFKGEKYFDYLDGKVMKIDLTKDDEFEERLYDRDNGVGSAQKAINSLKY